MSQYSLRNTKEREFVDNLCTFLLVLELMLCSGPGHVYEMLGGGLPEPGVNMGPIPSGRKSDLQQLMESTRGQFSLNK
jgi:hypothetical protein